jgi:WD40 repeat protein
VGRNVFHAALTWITGTPGITCLDLHPTKANLVVTGGVDRTLTLLDTASGKEIAVLSHHSKRVSCDAC